MRKVIAVLGILLFISAFGLGKSLKEDQLRAVVLDDEETKYGMIGDDVAPMCSWEVSPLERVMAESKSQAVVVQVENQTDKDCESMVALRAPGFDMSPAKEEQKINLPIGGKGSLSWIVVPRKTGTFQLAVSDVLNSKIFGVTVTNVFGLNAMQAKVFSTLGTLFGPMLTIPWWWDRWRQRKPKEETRKNEAESK